MSSRRRRRQKELSPSPQPSQSFEKDDDDDDDDDEENNHLDESFMEEEEEELKVSINDGNYMEENANDDEEEEEDNESIQPNNNHNNNNNNHNNSSSIDNSHHIYIDPNVDENTLRVMVATDNHLGFAERDPIRGNDSFAAFEEILILAKRHHCDMVLLGGDLFHENKPSRRTLHKTMDIIRRHTMGPNPISFQIISDQTQNFRSANPYNVVNYENPYISIDLPIFGIHGNHDDPTRDGGDEMLSAMDILAMGSLVNYFGRQDAVDKVQVSPVLIRKGETKVALYGMGHMRDERLNRMWQGKKVRFLRPEGGGKSRKDDDDDDDDDDDEDSEDEGAEWFNLFAIHQNRDFGRGTKNCVHDSMIPEWMDLVVWGHEHECVIQPAESAIGTFRISQPGSSVATALTEAESIPKCIGILDIKHSQFRLIPIPLMQVRPFSVGQICLANTGLDPDDMRVDQEMADILAREVEKLIQEARSSSRLLKHRSGESSQEGGINGDNEDDNGRNNHDKGDDKSLLKKLSFHVDKPDRVLVRLRVEHSGFPTLHNQRFGSRFVNEVANPSDLLLFHRKRCTEGKSSKSKKKLADGQDAVPNDPTFPSEIDEINVEDIVKDTLDTDDKKLQILDEDRLSLAVDAFVSKEQKQMIQETVTKIVNVQQKKLVKRGVDVNEETKDDGDVKLTTKNAIIEACQAETQRIRDSQFSIDIDQEEDDDSGEEKQSKKKKQAPARRQGRKKVESDPEEEYDDDEDIEIIEDSPSPKRGRKRKESSQVSAASTAGKRNRNRRGGRSTTYESDSDDDIIEDASPPPKKSRGATRTARGSRRATTKKSYREEPIEIDDDDDDSMNWGGGTQSTQSSSRSTRSTRSTRRRK